jgi:Domain of unknown function (DUF5076)
MYSPNELSIPVATEVDPKAFELLRVWIANKQQHVSLRTDVWEDPAAWGIMLADLAKHIAESFRKDNGQDVQSVLKRIKAGIDAELE